MEKENFPLSSEYGLEFCKLTIWLANGEVF